MTEDDDAALGFDWDAGNIAKCTKHGVSLMEIMEALQSPSLRRRRDHVHSVGEERVQAFAPTRAGRHIFVVFTRRHRHGMMLIRPISARYMHRSEVDALQEEDAGFHDRRGS